MFFCDIAHAVEWSRSEEANIKVKRLKKESEKELRLQTRKIKQSQKTISQLKIDAEKAVNAYIQERDREKPCCTCGKPKSSGKQFHAGHFIAVGSCDNLRFNCFNIHAQCATCNVYGHGEYRLYRQWMIDRYSTELVEAFEDIASTNPITKRSRDYLERIKSVFKKRKLHIVKLRKRINNNVL